MTTPPSIPDLAAIAGYTQAKHALEIAACRGHHLALMGGAGTGKTLLVCALLGLVPLHEPDTVPRVLDDPTALTGVQDALRRNPDHLGQEQPGIIVLE